MHPTGSPAAAFGTRRSNIVFTGKFKFFAASDIFLLVGKKRGDGFYMSDFKISGKCIFYCSSVRMGHHSESGWRDDRVGSGPHTPPECEAPPKAHSQ